MAVNDAQSGLVTNPQIVAIAMVIDPDIVLDGDDNGLDLTAVIVSSIAVNRQQILASDIAAGNWDTIAANFTTLSTAAGHSPGSIN
jgi:hypothetical protein